MPPVKTYSRNHSRNSASNKSRYDIINNIIFNPIKKKKVPNKIVIRELPAKAKQCLLSNSSLEVKVDDTFDRLVKEHLEDNNKIINPRKKTPNTSSIPSITVQNYSYYPIMTRNRALTLSRSNNSSMVKNINKTSSDDSSISKVSQKIRTLDRSVSNNLCIEKVKPKQQYTFNLSSLLNVANKSEDTPYEPMFSDTFKERYRNNPLIRKAAVIPSSTPIVQTRNADISVAISPIRNVTNENINTNTSALCRTPKVRKQKPIRKISVALESPSKSPLLESRHYDKSEIISKDIFDSDSDSNVLKDVSNIISDNVAVSKKQVLSATGDFKHFDSVDYLVCDTGNVLSKNDDRNKITTQNNSACAIIESNVDIQSNNDDVNRRTTQKHDTTENCDYKENSTSPDKSNALQHLATTNCSETAELNSSISKPAVEDNSEMVGTSFIEKDSKHVTTLENISRISRFTSTEGTSTNELALLYQENNSGEDSVNHSYDNGDKSRIEPKMNSEETDELKRPIDSKITSQNCILIDAATTQNSINSFMLQDSLKESASRKLSSSNIIDGTSVDHETSCFTNTSSELSTTNIKPDRRIKSNIKTSNDTASTINADISIFVKVPVSYEEPKLNRYITLRKRRVTIKPYVPRQKNRKYRADASGSGLSIWSNSDSSVCKSLGSIREDKTIDDNNFEETASKEIISTLEIDSVGDITSIVDDSKLEKSGTKLIDVDHIKLREEGIVNAQSLNLAINDDEVKTDAKEINLDNTKLGHELVVNIKRLNLEKIQPETNKRTSVEQMTPSGHTTKSTEKIPCDSNTFTISRIWDNSDPSSVCTSLERIEDKTIDDSNSEQNPSKEIIKTLNLEMDNDGDNIATDDEQLMNGEVIIDDEVKTGSKQINLDNTKLGRQTVVNLKRLNLERIQSEANKRTSVEQMTPSGHTSKSTEIIPFDGKTLSNIWDNSDSSSVCKSLESIEDTTIYDSNSEQNAPIEKIETLNLEMDNDGDTMATDNDSILEQSSSKQIKDGEVIINDEVKTSSKQINLDNTKLGQQAVVNMKRLNVEKILSETNKKTSLKRVTSGGRSSKSTQIISLDIETPANGRSSDTASPEEQPSKRSKTMKKASATKPGCPNKITENISPPKRILTRSKTLKKPNLKNPNQNNSKEGPQSSNQQSSSSKSLGAILNPETDDRLTKRVPEKVFVTPKVPRRKLQRKATLPIIDKAKAAKEAIMRSSNTHELTFKDPDDEDVVILRPGKLWRRSLLEVKNSRVDCSFRGNQSSCVALKGIVCTCIQCKRDNIGGSILPKRLSVRVVPLSPISPAFTSISYLENYAVSLYPSYISDGVQESILEDYEYLENLSLSGGQKTFQHLPHHREPELGRALTARDVVLRKCKQTEPLLFEKCYTNSMLQHCQKIGEGVYGEVFLFRNPNGGITVMKIIPIEGSLIVNGERQKKFEEILSEITIAMELSNLRNNARNNTNGFTELQKVMCVKGKYPERLLELWELYGESHGTENDSPEVFGDDQLYIILELANGGKDMEAYIFNNAQQAFALFQQIACALAVAEASLEFEHRDLHWGNILISNVDNNSTMTYYLNGKRLDLETNGVQLAIIDYTLSRIKHDGICIYNDLSLDPDLFNAKGDYQFDIYRMMRECNKNDWQSFRPFTNVLWLHYVLEKMIAGLRYRNKTSKVHKEYIQKLQSIRDDILSNKSAVEFVTGFLLEND